MADWKLVTYCGLHCDLCAQRGRIPSQAAALRRSMKAEGYDFWGVELPGFDPFWSFLGQLTDPDKACPGCRQDGGYPACEIRKCAREKNVEACALCGDFPCVRIESFARVYPTLVQDGKLLLEIGVEAWVEEQKRREASGFVYADCRCRIAPGEGGGGP
ncbi:MAG: DUF3795 domain-containing protein [Planctomycetota bacterium]|jgi:hypothetical protein